MPSAAMILLASLSTFSLGLLCSLMLTKRRRQADKRAAERIASLQRKIDAALQDGFDPAAHESFTALLRTASLTTGMQAPRLQALAKVDKQAPEKYRILAKLASQGMGAREIAATLGISQVEAGQLLSLSRMAASGGGPASFTA